MNYTRLSSTQQANSMKHIYRERQQVLNKEQIFEKIGKFDTYLNGVTQIAPAEFKDYQKIERK
jgi:hypothetical protein